MNSREFQEHKEWFGFSLKVLILIFLGILFFIIYLRYLIGGENSLPVLHKVEKMKQELIAQKRKLKEDNQKLQKEYFEYLQVMGDTN